MERHVTDWAGIQRGPGLPQGWTYSEGSDQEPTLSARSVHRTRIVANQSLQALTLGALARRRVFKLHLPRLSCA
ncbi:g3500 [Coccomyxa elongata]